MRVVMTGAAGNAGTALLRAAAAEPAVDEIVRERLTGVGGRSR